MAPRAAIVMALVLLALLAGTLLQASLSIGMMDQGDYPRTVSRIIGAALPAARDASADGAPTVQWALAQGFPIPNPSSGTSSFLFAASALVQSSYHDRFDLIHSGFAAKLLLIGSLGLLSVVAGRRSRVGAVGQAALAGALMVAAFSSHNIALLQSFYGEFSFILGLPLLLTALLVAPGRRQVLLLLGGLLMCGGAKAQFFYLPLLVLPVLWLQARSAGRRLPLATLGAVLLAQVLCLAPLPISDVMGFNRHHSTYLGSYLAMDDAQRASYGFSRRELDCIGLDAWGNRLATLASTNATIEPGPCDAAREVSFRDTIDPYLRYPVLAWRMIRVGLPPHLTVNYFHVDARTRYVVLLDAPPAPQTRALFVLSEFRDRIVRPWNFPLVLAFGFIFGIIRLCRDSSGLGAPLLFLSCVVITQVPVTLLGEGVRDLSKHLAGAQYALDLLIVLVVFEVVRTLWAVARPDMRLATPSSQLDPKAGSE
jgi:hypothetical protein